MSLRIQFLGGVGTVTGSKFLLECKNRRILIDCGLFQGLKELRLQNWEPLPVDPATIDTVILTHAHLDHSGYLPLLVKNGFRGRVFCTAPTKALAKVILRDSAKIQEEDAAYANKMGFSKHHPARPLYALRDASAAFRRLSDVPVDTWVEGAEGVKFRFQPNGHILGSAFVEIRAGGVRLVFSGDMGRSKPLLLHPPTRFPGADYLIVESTYGDRLHESRSPSEALAHVVNETIGRSGHVIIPSFAVGRAQDLIYLLSLLKSERRIPDVPVYLDSPMGIDATEIFMDYPEWHTLSAREVKEFCKTVTMVRNAQQSAELRRRRASTIVIAGSGMLAGGRVLHHLESRLGDERNTILLVGYQAAGSRGRLLREGIGELKMHGRYVPVRARVAEIATLSAHADQQELLNWLGHSKKAPRRTFIVHGEPQAADALRVKIRDTLGWDCHVPRPLEQKEL